MAWDKTKPTNDNLLINAPGEIRANWEAIELGTEPNLLITNAKCASDMNLDDAKLANITSTGKVSGSALTNLGAIPSNAGSIPLANIPPTLTGKDADTLDGQHGSYYRSADNINAGSLKHEYGGIETDISAITKGGIIVGTGSGTMGIKTPGTDGHYLKYDSSVAGGITSGELTINKNSDVTFKAYRSGSDQGIGTGENVKLQFNAEDFDVSGNYDSTTNYRFTALSSGKYLLGVTVTIDYGTGASRKLYLKLNGTTDYMIHLDALTGSGDINESFGGSILMNLNQNDYLEVYTDGSGPTQPYLKQGIENSYFWGFKLT